MTIAVISLVAGLVIAGAVAGERRRQADFGRLSKRQLFKYR
jgi:hypothetical protein